MNHIHVRNSIITILVCQGHACSIQTPGFCYRDPKIVNLQLENTDLHVSNTNRPDPSLNPGNTVRAVPSLAP